MVTNTSVTPGEKLVKYPQILKVLVGSHAHGLAGPESDYDYRAVFVQPTSEILTARLNNQKALDAQWIEGDVDNTAYEIGHFLALAIRSNPTILETFVAPRVNPPYPINYPKQSGDQLVALFPYVWDSTAAWNAFKGYGYNQRKKFLDDKDKRANKYAVAWLRTLILAEELLTEGTMTLNVSGHPEFTTLRNWKDGNWHLGEVMDKTNEWIERVDRAYEKAPKRTSDIGVINDYLLSVRKAFWE